MASVFKAYHAAMDRYVAVKVLPQHLAKSDPQFIGRFQQEARLLAKLQHPHILPVFDFGDADGYTYLVMPLIETGTLRDLLPSKPLPLKQIRNIVTQVGDALDYAHTRGLVHRDVKPSNVLVDERGNCTLTDFGIAKMVEGTAHFTSTGGIIGTPAYMSPEQGRGLKVDARTDLYSLGVMLYEMATGRVPFDAETPVAVIFMHVQDPLPLPRKINPDLPESVERVILKSLAKDPDDRYQSTKALVEALQGAVDAAEHQKPTRPVAIEQTNWDMATPTTVEAKTRPAAMPTPKANQPRWKWLVAVLTVVGLIAVVAITAVLPRQIDSSTPISQSTTRLPTSAPTQVATEVPTLTPTPITSFEYTVVSGDTCLSIAEKFGITIEELSVTNNQAFCSPGDALIIPRSPDELTQVAQSSATSVLDTGVANWATTFEYRFPSTFWAEGTHTYTIVMVCPKRPDRNVIATKTFRVSGDPKMLGGNVDRVVYLHDTGPRRDISPNSESVAFIGNLQVTVGIVSYERLTSSAAESLSADCEGRISWDGGAPQPLIPQTPFQH